MAPQFERGVYEPSDEVRVFDGTEEDEDMEGSRLPLLIVLALMVLAMFGGLVWLAYTQGVARGRSETPVLTAAAGPEKVAPQNPGGANLAYQGFKIYEQPAPADDEGDGPVAVAKPAPAAQTPAPATPPPPVAETVKPAPQQMAAVQHAPPPVVKSIAKPVPTPAAKPAPKSVAAAPVAKPIAQPAALASSSGPATAPPRQLAPAMVAPKPVPAASGSYVLQIGAYKSQADADAAWKAYKAKHAALLSGYGPDVQQADLGEKGTWYRLRIGGLASKDGAAALCDRLKADGGGCFLGK